MCYKIINICDNCHANNRCFYKSERKTVCNLKESEDLIEICSIILSSK